MGYLDINLDNLSGGGGGGGGVTSLNGETGAVDLIAGSNITITPSGNNITISTTGGSGVSSVNGQTGAVVLTPTDIAYSPLTPSDWVTSPTNEQQALDDLAATKAFGKNLSTAFTLVDNVSTPTTFLSFSTSSINFSVINYSIVRNNDFHVGTLYIANSSSVVSLVDNSTDTASAGITITATISGGNVLVQYTSTSTGFNASLKTIAQQWS